MEFTTTKDWFEQINNATGDALIVHSTHILLTSLRNTAATAGARMSEMNTTSFRPRETRKIHHRVRRDRSLQTRQPREGAAKDQPRDGAAEDGQYCAQACLLGLVRGSPLDPACPNVASHRGPDSGTQGDNRTHHPVDHATWLQLLGMQLKRTLDDGIKKLWKDGAQGVLFKVTLLAYDYTFACKETVRAFIRDLEHEAAVYKRLERIQGVNVPVFLGAVDLRPLKRVYYYDHRVYIVHMTFLSWA